MIWLVPMRCLSALGRRHLWAATVEALDEHGSACPFCGDRSEVAT